MSYLNFLRPRSSRYLRLFTAIAQQQPKEPQKNVAKSPTVFLHIPKCAGTSFSTSLCEALNGEATEAADWRYDLSTMGNFDGVETIASEFRDKILGPVDTLPQDARFVTGHMAFSTTQRIYPNARFCTVLREASSRILSHWLYWRQLNNAQLAPWGEYQKYFAFARGHFAEFLCAPQLAPQIDNLALRMLLWPDERLPPDAFIDPRFDDSLIEDALERVGSFAFVDYIENTKLSENVQAWIGTPFELKRLNETAIINEHFPVSIDQELCPEVMILLDERGRLDNRLWRAIVGGRSPTADIASIRERTFGTLIERYRHV